MSDCAQIEDGLTLLMEWLVLGVICILSCVFVSNICAAAQRVLCRFALGGARHVQMDHSENTRVVVPKLVFPAWFLPRVAQQELHTGLKHTANQFGEETRSARATEILGKLNSARDVVAQARQEVVFASKHEARVHVGCVNDHIVGRCCPCCTPLRHRYRDKQMIRATM